MDDPTPEQIEASRLAGWDPGQPGDPDYPKAPPDGWDAHSLPPEDDPALGNNGVPAPQPGDEDYVEPTT